jgi:hypothetical protein
MAHYTILRSGMIQMEFDGAVLYVPADHANRDYAGFIAWQEAGGVPDIEPERPVPVPSPVSRFQARAALHIAGRLAEVEALMQSPSTPMLARLAWQDAIEFRRESPTVAAMGAALGMSDADIDALFVSASEIEA